MPKEKAFSSLTFLSALHEVSADRQICEDTAQAGCGNNSALLGLAVLSLQA